MDRKKNAYLCGAAAFLLLIVTPYAIEVLNRAQTMREFADEHERAVQMLQTLQQHPPEDIEPADWENVVEHLIGGVGNALFSSQTVPVEEMRKYRQELAARVEPPATPTLDDLIWAWDRMGDASPQAAAHIERQQPAFDQAIDAAR